MQFHHHGYVSGDPRVQPAAGLLRAAPITIDSYSDEIDLTITDLNGYDVILGMPWLHHYNPRIDWKKEVISFVDKRRRAHRLRTQPTRNESSSPAAVSSSSPPASTAAPAARLNLITVKQLKHQWRTRQLDAEFACLVFPQDVRAIVDGAAPVSLATPTSVVPPTSPRPPSRSLELSPLAAMHDALERGHRVDSARMSAVIHAVAEDPLGRTRACMLQEFADVFPEDLPPGLPPQREVDHRIETLPGAKPPSRPIKLR